MMHSMPQQQSLESSHVPYKSVFVVVGLCCFLQGCPSNDGSRLAHYRGGGPFSGAGPSLSPDGKHILFSSPKTGNGDVYRIDLDGTNIVRLTTDQRYDCDASYSPDSKSIVFIREENGEGDVWIMNADGTGDKQLTKDSGDEGAPQFWPGTSQVVFWRTVPELKSQVGIGRARELWMVDMNTGDETRLTNNKIEDVFPAVSPNGKFVACARNFQILTMNRNGEDEKLLGPGCQSAISPDSKQLAIQSGKYGRLIDTMNVDGSQRRTVYSKDTRVSNPAFLPDGSGIVFLEEPRGQNVGRIMRMNLDGSSVQLITDVD